MARVKKVIPTGITSEQMNEAFAKYNAADAEEQKITAQMDKQITAIREKNAEKLDKTKAAKEAAFDIMQAYATEHGELFEKKKSLETTHGVLGFRTGTPKLKTKKGFTWAAVLAVMKEKMPTYIRTKEEPMKDKLLADRDAEGMIEKMSGCGIDVVQDETFYIEPKKEEA